MMNMIDHDLLSVQEGRILAENAAQAQKVLSAFTQAQLDAAVETIAERVQPHLRALAEASAGETDCGNAADKELKNRFVCQRVREALRGMACVGIIARDEAAHTMDVGVPRGPILALCPTGSPVSTTLYKAMIAVKSGNSIIFILNPKARRTMEQVLELILAAAKEAGLPEGAISYLSTVAPAGIRELIHHRAVAQILITGVPEALAEAGKSGKPVFYGGEGNGPAFIERTADLEKAVRDIVSSKTFDCGAMIAAEQSVVVDAPVDEAVQAAFRRAGGYFLTEEESRQLREVLFLPDGGQNEEFVGKSAKRLAAAAGFSVPEGTVLLLVQPRYVSEKDPFPREKCSPVLAYYVEEDWQLACEKCIELLLREKGSHTLVIHSRDEAVIEQFALKKPVARVLVNTPSAFGGMGITTNLFPAMTLGSVGLGMTVDNVSPMNLVYIRKVGYGVREPEEVFSLDGQEALERVRDHLKALLGCCGWDEMRP